MKNEQNLNITISDIMCVNDDTKDVIFAMDLIIEQIKEYAVHNIGKGSFLEQLANSLETLNNTTNDKCEKVEQMLSKIRAVAKCTF